MAKDKVGQQLKREIRQYVRQQFNVLDAVIKPRPKYCPRWLWRTGARIFIDTAQLQNFFENGVDISKPIGQQGKK